MTPARITSVTIVPMMNERWTSSRRATSQIA